VSKRRVYLFGIGSPEWQQRTGHVVNERGVPIATRPVVSERLRPAAEEADWASFVKRNRAAR
jgi:hypothetical protein